ncbi:MAG TPA: hypothetical protein VE130_16255 [Nitrososphaeraceae archaeon]|nr:hypothetical protein [Nitrososphaeraceae archaeon]
MSGPRKSMVMMIFTTFGLILSLSIWVGHLGNTAMGQQQVATNISGIPLSANDTTSDEILSSLQTLIRQNEKLMQQNDDSSENALIGSYIGMLAFLTGLGLVIFGLQMSRGDKITPISRIYYRILILVLVLPVIGIIIFAYIARPDPEYLGVISLLLIPAVAVLILSQSRKLLDKL